MALDNRMDIEPSSLRDTVTNARIILDEIKERFPNASIARVSKIADVSMSTVNRWRSTNRADREYFETVFDYYDERTEDGLDGVLLRDATVKQLRKRIDEVGWKKICRPRFVVKVMPKKSDDE